MLALPLARVNYGIFIAQATAITIVIYDRNTFRVQATGFTVLKSISSRRY